MTAREAGFLGCRLMALFWFISGMIQLPFSLFSLKEMGRFADGNYGMMLTGQFAASVGPLIASAILFYGAGLLSRMMAPEHATGGRALDTRSLIRIGFILIAAWTVAQFIPGLVQLSIRMFTSRPTDPERGNIGPTLVANGIGVLVLVLIVWFAIKTSRSEPQRSPDRGDAEQGDREVSG